MKGLVQLLAAVGLVAATVGVTRWLWPRDVIVQGPPVTTVVDVTDATRAAYEDQVRTLQDRIRDLLDQPQPINHTDTLWRDSLVRIPIPCPGTVEVPAEPLLPPQWYLVDGTFPTEQGAEGLVAERQLGVLGGYLERQEQLRQVFMYGPITSISGTPDGMHYTFGQWPAPHCRASTKLAWGGGGMGLTALLVVLFGGG